MAQLFAIPRHIRLTFACVLVFLAISCSPGYRTIKSSRTQYPVNAGVPQDSTLIRNYMPYKKQLDAQMNEVLGYSENAIIKRSSLPESLLGNFFADANLAEAKKLDVSIDFAMPSTDGGLRADLPAGAIRLTNVFELMPFENELLVLDLKGEDVASLLDYIAASNGQPVAGIKLKIVNKKAVNVTIGGVPFDKKITYRVLTSDYIAGGGDNVKGLQSPLKTKILGLKVRDALINYIKAQQAAGKKLTVKLDGRITKD